VGVRAPPQQSSLSPSSLVRTDRDGVSEDERSTSRVVEFSKVDMTIDLELSDVSTMGMTRTKSPSPPPTPMFDSQQVDSGV
jgi:hypothetical protein